MTQQMHLVVLAKTGHILAAVAQTIAAGDPDLAALVGTDLPVMRPALTGATPPISTLVPAELLEVKTVAYDAAVLAFPHFHVVDGGRVARIPPTGALTPTLRVAATSIPATPAVAITVILSSTADATVEPRVGSGTLDPAAPVLLTHNVVPGNTAAAITQGDSYVLLIACAGRRLQWVLTTAAA